MAKKYKRNVSKSTPAVTKAVEVKAESANGVVKPRAATVSSNRFGVTFNPDYEPVKKDLTRIGIMAGSFFVILIALTFFLR
jgi:hypothetical protein